MFCNLMLKEKNRKRKCCANIRKDPVKHKKYKEDEKIRKMGSKENKTSKCSNGNSPTKWRKFFATNNSSPNSGLSFSCKQTLYRSIVRADLHLPKSPNKKAEVIQRLATKYKLRKNLKENRRKAK